jgi:glycosyltransferase involved in cell wall biosynthesis
VRALILTNEFPPETYGGAGVHVAELTRHLRELVELDIRTFGITSLMASGGAYGAIRRPMTCPAPTNACARCWLRCRVISRWWPTP